jgi:hypothetical protein
MPANKPEYQREYMRKRRQTLAQTKIMLDVAEQLKPSMLDDLVCNFRKSVSDDDWRNFCELVDGLDDVCKKALDYTKSKEVRHGILSSTHQNLGL